MRSHPVRLIFVSAIALPLAGELLDFASQPTELQLVELDLTARIVDVYADQIAACIVIQNDAFGDLPTFDTHLLRQVYVQRIGVLVISKLHGLNPRSGNAL